MNTAMLAGVLVYALLLVGGSLFWLARRTASGGEAEFELAGRGLSVPILIPTLALTILGSAHILGVFEMSWFMGGTAMWFGLACALAIAVVCLTTGRWMRRLRLATVPELLEYLFGPGIRTAVCCVMAGVIFGLLTLETQGIGILLAAATGWNIQACVVMAGALGVLYVILAGMKEVGWINLVNCVVMYLCLILATVYIAAALPDGFDTVAEHYRQAGEAHQLTIFGPMELLLTFALGLVIAVNFSVPVNQFMLQVAMSARSERAVVRAMWLAVPINGLFCVFIVVLGMTAKTLPEFAGLGPKLAAPTMLVQLLPGWLAVLLIGSFVAAVLTTFAMTCLAPATIYSMDLHKRLFRPGATGAEITRVTRTGIVLLGVAATAIAGFLPPILAALSWLLAWLIPILWLVFTGLFWRRSTTAAAVTLVLAWTANMIWTFTPVAEAMGLQQVKNVYVALAVTLVAGTLANLFVGRAKGGYFKSPEYAARVAGG